MAQGYWRVQSKTRCMCCIGATIGARRGDVERLPQYTAYQILGELRWWGFGPSPSYVGELECSPIMERWIRTLKEECPYLHDFDTLDEARRVIGEFIGSVLIEQHGHRTPTNVRRVLTHEVA